MKFPKSVKMAAVSFFTAFVLFMVIMSARENGIVSLQFAEILQYFIFIPLLTFLFYYLFSKKFDEFNERFVRIEKQFERMTSKLEAEERGLVGEEKTLRSEISDLKTVVISLNKSISSMKKAK